MNLVEYMTAKPYPIPDGVFRTVSKECDEDRELLFDLVKTCRKCGETKSSDQFNLRYSSKMKPYLQSICKACHCIETAYYTQQRKARMKSK